MIQSYQQLAVWQKSIELAKQVYLLTRVFPREELFGLTNQIRRAAVSIAGNIAEGQGRNNTKEFLHFLGISRGSLNEIETHLVIAEQVGFISGTDSAPLLAIADEIGRMLTGLRRSLERNNS
jgi:four helix bundle protein